MKVGTEHSAGKSVWSMHPTTSVSEAAMTSPGLVKARALRTLAYSARRQGSRAASESPKSLSNSSSNSNDRVEQQQQQRVPEDQRLSVMVRQFPLQLFLKRTCHRPVTLRPLCKKCRRRLAVSQAPRSPASLCSALVSHSHTIPASLSAATSTSANKSAKFPLLNDRSAFLRSRPLATQLCMLTPALARTSASGASSERPIDHCTLRY